MERKDFIKAMALLPLAGAAMKLSSLAKMTGSFEKTDEMPVLFLGHGNPMNALMENEFTKGWAGSVSSLPKPNAVLCISAHWETKGTFVTAMEKPQTIHDFGGFPQELFDFQYPAPGSPTYAEETKKVVSKTQIGMDHNWGFDHGCWSVVKHLYPNADIPVIQMSIDYTKPAQWHFELAKELAALRKKGVLIVGSGNIVHNLGRINWNDGAPFDWAVEANEKVKSLVTGGDYNPLISYENLGSSMKLAVPTPEHYLPLLYVLGLKGEKDKAGIFNDKIEMGSIAMTAVKIDKA
jgi:4,5-DOPA dioxygenase extradiol